MSSIDKYTSDLLVIENEVKNELKNENEYKNDVKI
jgi:hypothetical protein